MSAAILFTHANQRLRSRLQRCLSESVPGWHSHRRHVCVFFKLRFTPGKIARSKCQGFTRGIAVSEA